MRLFRTFIFRALLRDLTRSALCVLSITLGVAVVVAMDLAGRAATGSFRASLETLAGNTDLQIVANGSIDERWMARLAALPLNARFLPVLEAQALIGQAGSFALLGLDLVAQGQRLSSSGHVDADNAILVSEALATRLRLAPGDELAVIVNDLEHRFAVAGTLKARPASEFLVLDIAAAQKALGRYGALDRIDVMLGPSERLEEVERQLRAVLPPAYSIQKPGTRSEENQRMLRAFRWNLRVLSYISLVVGAFLIYNTVSVSVVRRRPEIGVLRALGAGRGRILWLFLGEALMLAVVGSAAGVIAGRLLAEIAVGMIAQTVNMLYVSSRPEPVALQTGDALIGITAGILVAFVSALQPAREAMRVSPVEAMSRGAPEHQARLRWKPGLLRSALIAAGAAAAAGFGPWDGKPVGGYVSALLAICSAAFAAPALIVGITALLRGAVGKVGPAAILATRSFVAALPRTSVMLGALAAAVAMMISIAIMVGSFRETVRVWLDTQLRADLYLRPSGRSGAGQFPAVSPEVPRLVASVSGVAAVDVFHGLELHYGGERATLGAGDLDVVRRYGRLRFLEPDDRDAILRSLPGQDRAIISEPFANKHGLRAGDLLPLRLGERTVNFTVAGVYYDYSSSQGVVIIDRSTLLKYLPRQPPTNVAVYLKPHADARAAAESMQKILARYHVVVAPNSELRRQAMVIFDRTFAVTYALEAVAILVAMLGAANSLLAMVLDRRRELALLRYFGASSAQLRRVLLFEAGYLGGLAAALGIALGVVLSLLLIYVVNKQSFGWTIQFEPPVAMLAWSVLAVWCATVMAGAYPARIAQLLSPTQVLHND